MRILLLSILILSGCHTTRGHDWNLSPVAIDDGTDTGFGVGLVLTTGADALTARECEGMAREAK